MAGEKQIYGGVRFTLDPVILPDAKLVTTPSELDGLSKDLETDLRYFGCELIQTAGIGLNLSKEILTSAQVLFHRFYYAKSFLCNPVEMIAGGCLFLAARIGEDRRAVKDIVCVMELLRNRGKSVTPVHSFHVLQAEKMLLKELGFMVYVQTPFKDLCNGNVCTYMPTSLGP